MVVAGLQIATVAYYVRGSGKAASVVTRRHGRSVEGSVEGWRNGGKTTPGLVPGLLCAPKYERESTADTESLGKQGHRTGGLRAVVWTKREVSASRQAKRLTRHPCIDEPLLAVAGKAA